MTGAPEGTDWRRLDARTIGVVALWGSGLALVTLTVMWWRDAPWWLVAPVPVPLVSMIAYEALRWSKTRYRLTAEHLELKTGLLVRRHRSIPRGRVRSVDLTADPMHRLLRLAVVRVGTGHRESSSKAAAVSLNALRRAEAQPLRLRPPGLRFARRPCRDRSFRS
ncbi:PH domain-containing protein [Nonomuraea terrae]|uniref:PH domain-containing protein n=1 Tax=Nonomuraea terrae TaxID=2530383 RepID=UPI00379756F9